MSFASLQAGIEELGGFSSPADLMAALPETVRAYPNLVFESRGLEKQKVSLVNPRVILYLSKSSLAGDYSTSYLSRWPNDPFLLMAFTPGSNKVEAIEFDGSLFSPHQVEFETKGSVTPGPKPGAKPIFDHGLFACFACHTALGKEKSKGELKSLFDLEEFSRQAFHPLITSYRVWEGWYGSHHFNEGVTKLENPHLEKFRVKQSKEGFYRYLPKLQDHDSTAFSHLNTNLTQIVQSANARRVVGVLKGESSFERFLPALLHATSQSPMRRDFVEDSGKWLNTLVVLLPESKGITKSEAIAEIWRRHKVFEKEGFHLADEAAERNLLFLGSLPKSQRPQREYSYPPTHESTTVMEPLNEIALGYVLERMGPKMQLFLAEISTHFVSNPLVPLPQMPSGAFSQLDKINEELRKLSIKDDFVATRNTGSCPEKFSRISSD